MSDSVRHAVRSVLSAVLQREVGAGEEVSRASEARWDSLRHMEIVFSIEDALGIEFEEGELAHLDSYSRLVECAERHRAA